MASTGRPLVDFSKFPDVSEWYVKDSIPFGCYEYSLDLGEGGGYYYASHTTLAALEQHRKLCDGHGNAIPAIPAKDTKTREAVLDEAKSLVVGDRNSQYGEPYDDFLKVAEALNAYGYRGPGDRKIMPRDVPFFQALVKLSRLIQSPTKRDSWVDLAGYAACGAEVADIEAAK